MVPITPSHSRPENRVTLCMLRYSKNAAITQHSMATRVPGPSRIESGNVLHKRNRNRQLVGKVDLAQSGPNEARILCQAHAS